ncbi:MAG: polysaccharide biosynthesis/export family protein [Muribaculaceae bacterium]|nr:polysaccharide biosynthesis/export family protein [Muribaculaceae bacterium]
MKLLYLPIVFAAIISLASCSSPKNILPYFVDIKDVKTGELDTLNYLPTILPDDELSIMVSSINPEATALYQMPLINPATTSTLASAASPRFQTYIVDSKGDIDFPVLGTIHVSGMTTEQLSDYLTKEISKDVKDPVVDVRILNFMVSVGGEVRSPSRIPLTKQRMTVLEALVQAGDLTEYGERSNVLVIREENGKRTYTHLDLNKAETLNSPYFYLKQNDYIYVSPNNIKQSNSRYNTNNSFKLSVISTIVSATSVVASLVIALVVK